MITDRHIYFQDDTTEETKRRRVLRHMVKNRIPPTVDWRAVGEVVKAKVNHGRWIVDCPNGCNNAEFAGDGFPFVCTVCGYGPSRVVFPDNRQAIETTLLKRPQAAQNWEPGETIEELELANQGQGVA